LSVVAWQTQAMWSHQVTPQVRPYPLRGTCETMEPGGLSSSMKKPIVVLYFSCVYSNQTRYSK